MYNLGTPMSLVAGLNADFGEWLCKMMGICA